MRSPGRSRPGDNVIVTRATGGLGGVTVMHAHIGDRLVLDHDRIGVVIGVPSEDGKPPYIVKWLKDGHIAMVTPDQYSRIVSGQRPGGSSGKPPDTPRGGQE